MCPPKQCCCCDIYQGVRIWSIVFIALSAIYGVIMIVLAGILTAWCEDPNISLSSTEQQNYYDTCYGDDAMAKIASGEAPDESDYLYKQTAMWMTVGAIVSFIEMGVNIFGCISISNFNASNIKVYWIIVAVFAGLEFLAQLLSLNVLGGVIGLAFSIWWIVAVKSLGDQIANGTITRENPTGAPAVATGIQMAAVPAQAVAVPAQAMVVPAQAVAVVKPEAPLQGPSA